MGLSVSGRADAPSHPEAPSACSVGSKGEEVTTDGFPEERVIWRERFQGLRLDFRGKSIFIRFDGCEFVKCTLLIDHETVHLFTQRVFQECNDSAQQRQDHARIVAARPAMTMDLQHLQQAQWWQRIRRLPQRLQGAVHGCI
jgi:hypothetical protein